jgi:hypothetical protein
MSKKRVGFVIHFDITNKGLTDCGVEWINRWSKINPDYEIIPISLSKLQSNRIRRKTKIYKDPMYDKTVYMDTNLDLSILDDIDIVISNPTPNSIIGGTLKTGWVYAYKIFSHMTNVLRRPVWLLLQDSEIVVRDIRDITANRSNGNLNDYINTHPDNIRLKEILFESPRIDYNNLYWLANGNRNVYDWILESITIKSDSVIPIQDEELCKRNTIYVGEDIWF